MRTDSIEVLLLGDNYAAEWRPVKQTLQTYRTVLRIRQVGCVDEALDEAADGWSPDLGIVCQTWSDEFSPADVERLLGHFSTARWICGFGAWCESDGRNRQTWPIGLRTPLRCLPHRLSRELQVLTDAREPLPLTASRDEAFHFEWSPDVQTRSLLLERVQVVSADRAYRDMLADFLSAWGVAVCQDTSAGEPDAIICDIDPPSERTLNQLRRLRAAQPAVAIIVVSTLAYPQDAERFRACGADNVVAKLASLDVLALALKRTVAIPAIPAAG